MQTSKVGRKGQKQQWPRDQGHDMSVGVRAGDECRAIDGCEVAHGRRWMTRAHTLLGR